ncbi:SDR family oxidoreductase [Chloroflexi bacterium TSY]|nr:SDR family oxidoreductase [Chloroflexi bacterium TSY]
MFIFSTLSHAQAENDLNIDFYLCIKSVNLILNHPDYAKDNIRVLAINPGTIETPLVAEAAAAMGSSVEELSATWAKAHPLGRIGQPIEIGRVARFLASDEASFMTGEWVNVDGGMMARGSWA